MPRPPRQAAARAVEDLLRDLGPQLRRGGVPEAPAGCIATGIADIDRLLGGGFPRGRLSEIAGAASSGRTHAEPSPPGLLGSGSAAAAFGLGDHSSLAWRAVAVAPPPA